MKTLLRSCLAVGALTAALSGILVGTEPGSRCSRLSQKDCQQCCVDEKAKFKAFCNEKFTGQEQAQCEQFANDAFQRCKNSCGTPLPPL